MQKGFTLFELLITMVIMAIAVGAVSLSLPFGRNHQAEQEETRLEWVVAEAHAVAQRYRTTLAVERLKDANGYRVLNVPNALKKEPWALVHECTCLFIRLDTNNPAAPIVVSSDPILASFTMRIDASNATRTLEYPRHAQ